MTMLPISLFRSERPVPPAVVHRATARFLPTLSLLLLIASAPALAAAPDSDASFAERWFLPTLVVGILALLALAVANAITRRTLLREVGRLENEARAAQEQASRLLTAESKAQAEIASTRRARHDFLATLGQEVRTPMNSILGLNGLLLDTDLSPQQRQLADGVQTSAEALLSIVHDLLDLSRLERGQSPVEETDLHFRQVLESAVDMYADRAHHKGLELISWVAPEVPVHLRGDPARIRQVLLSLLSHTVKLATLGEVIVEARLDESSVDRTVVSVEFTHEGPSPQIPAPGSPAGSASQDSSDHLGLGMAVSARLLDCMGGSLNPISPVDGRRGGMVARLVLKRPIPAATPSPAPKPVAAQEPPFRPFKDLTVLVGSTHPGLRRVIRQHFANWGAAQCLECTTGTEMLNSLRRSRQAGSTVRVALIDHALPDVNGTELARAIRADSMISGTRLVALKPLAEPFDSSQLRQHGFDSWVTKPVRQSHLLHALLHAAHGAEVSPTLDPAALLQVRPAGDELSGLRVLVAEDNLPNQVFARLLMLRLGFEASVAENGVRALEILAQEPFDLVLMDCHMPQLDGFEATRMIRASGAPWSGVPIIAVTADTVPGVREACLEAGMNDYVSKPLKTEELLRAIRKVIGARVVMTPAEAAPAR